VIDDALAQLVEDAVIRALAAWTPPQTPTPVEERPRLLDVNGAASLLSVSPATVRRLIETGQLRATRVLGAVRVDRRDLEAYIEAAKGATE
jgi:excisionase family DNA binding protein